ncbi:MAG: SLC13 family permease [Anaerolineales bacterium]
MFDLAPEVWTIAILVFAIVFFLTEWLRIDVVALIVVVALMLTNVLTPSEAIAGFSSTAVITIAALFIVGGAIFQTGLAAIIGERILRVAGRNEARLLIVLMVAVAALSGFMSNTGTVAVLLPAVLALAASAQINAARLMMPLAFASSLGGALTLIGTPPNIIVNNTLRDEGLPTFAFFDYTPVGILLLMSGIAFMFFFGRGLLPNAPPPKKDARLETPEELLDMYRLPDNIYRLRVRDASPIKGKTLDDVSLPERYNLLVLEILRPAEPMPLLRVGTQQLTLESSRVDPVHPRAETIVQHNDVLLVRGSEEDMGRAIADLTLALQPAQASDRDTIINQEGGIAEVLVTPRSEAVGKTLVDIRFGKRNRLTVLSIRKPGEALDAQHDIKNTRLESGDIMLVQGLWHDILALKDNVYDYVVLGQPERMMGAPHRNKAPLAALIMFGMVLLLVLDVMPTVQATLLAAVAMVLAGCLTMDEAYDAIDWKSLILIAGMLPMSTALVKVGLIDDLANGLTASVGELGPLAVLAALFGLTMVFTQVLSNTATAVIIAPLALVTARDLGVSAEPFLMGVAMAASMAFASPVASPVNTLVMGAGNYRFIDYVKVGVPLSSLMFAIAMLVIPLLFPF